MKNKYGNKNYFVSFKTIFHERFPSEKLSWILFMTEFYLKKIKTGINKKTAMLI